MMATRLLITLLLAASVVPASAQDGSEATGTRTVEGAQKFLSELYAKGGARVETGGYRSGNIWKWEKFEGSESVMLDGRVDGLRPFGRCRSLLSISAPVKKRWRTDVPSDPLDIGAAQLELLIDWSKLTRVKSEPGWVYEPGGSTEVPSGWERAMIYWSAGGSAFFMHLDKADAERASFAMQFLKEMCGPKNDTGF